MTPAVLELKQNYNDQGLDHVLEYFIKNRTANLQRYKILTKADCTRTSLHPRVKLLMNPVDLAYFDAGHDDHHLVRIREIQEAFNR